MTEAKTIEVSAESRSEFDDVIQLMKVTFLLR